MRANGMPREPRAGGRAAARRALVALMFLAGAAPSPPAGRAAQVDIEVFAPAREAVQAIQAARRARAAELAAQDLRLADLYLEDAAAALNPASGPPDVQKATRLAKLAAAQAKVAETRAVEVVRGREAAAAGSEYLDVIEGDPKRMLPPRPPMAQSAAEYRRLLREAAEARAARRAAEEARDQLLNSPR